MAKLKLHWRLLLTVMALLGILAIAMRALRPEPLAVSVHRIERGSVVETVSNTRAGTVKACSRARISPPMGGQVAKLWVREGDAVTAGRPLLELWNQDLTAQVRLAREEVSAARARSNEACFLAQAEQREALRQTELQKKGLAAEDRVDRAVSTAKAQDAGCKASQVNIAVAEARVDVAQAALGRTVLIAPFAGHVAELNAEVGEYVTPSPPGIATLPTIDLIDGSCLFVAAPVDEVDSPRVQLALPVNIRLDAFGDKSFPARITRIAPYVLELEKQARTVEVEARFDDPTRQHGLLPGLSADVEVVVATRDNVLRVPTEALIDGYKLLVFTFDGSPLVERQIKTGVGNWQFVEVVDGLAAGEQVVLSVDRKGVAAGVVVQAERGK